MIQYKKMFLTLALMALLITSACAAKSDSQYINDLESQIEELATELESAQTGEFDNEVVAELQEQLQEAQDELAAAQGSDDYEKFDVEFKNPETLTYMTIGEPLTLDPAVMYDTASSGVIRQLYDTLTFPKKSSVDEFVPMLATDWTVSEDALTYTFEIREGVTFHAGGTLEPHDVAYTFHRNLLSGWDFLEMGGPMGLYFDVFFNGEAPYSEYGIGSVESEIGLINAPGVGGDDLALCQRIQEVVVADDEAGTVTMHLAYPAGFFMQLVSQPWVGIMDMEWMADQGAWDGDCATWRDYYAIDQSGTALYEMENGTGPYMLDHWTHGEETVLTANEDWWVEEPLWDGSTIDGVPSLKTVVVKLAEEWGTRLAAVQAGDTDLFDAEIAFAAQTDKMVQEWIDFQTGVADVHNPEGILRLVQGLPGTSSVDLFMNFDVNTEGGNPWIGSGQLDGAGIPPDFFSDVHVRRAFNYCFDRETFISDVRQGEAITHRGPIISGMLGYVEDSEVFDFDLAKCEEEFKLAFDGKLWEEGFMLSLLHNSGNDSRRIGNEILRDTIMSINDKFIITIAQLPWPTYGAERRVGRIPIHQTGWLEDFHHPHNWVIPYMSCNGYFSSQQNLPEELCGRWDEMINEAVYLSGPDPAAAAALYAQLQAEAVEQAIDIYIHQPTGRHYEQMWVEGWYFHPTFGDPYYAGMSKVAP